jgi:hypothetical protein
MQIHEVFHLKKRAGKVAQVLEHLPSKHEVPSSKPQNHKKKKKKENRYNCDGIPMPELS